MILLRTGQKARILFYNKIEVWRVFVPHGKKTETFSLLKKLYPQGWNPHWITGNLMTDSFPQAAGDQDLSLVVYLIKREFELDFLLFPASDPTIVLLSQSLAHRWLEKWKSSIGESGQLALIGWVSLLQKFSKINLTLRKLQSTILFFIYYFEIHWAFMGSNDTTNGDISQPGHGLCDFFNVQWLGSTENKQFTSFSPNKSGTLQRKEKWEISTFSLCLLMRFVQGCEWVCWALRQIRTARKARGCLGSKILWSFACVWKGRGELFIPSSLPAFFVRCFLFLQ